MVDRLLLVKRIELGGYTLPLRGFWLLALNLLDDNRAKVPAEVWDCSHVHNLSTNPGAVTCLMFKAYLLSNLGQLVVGVLHVSE